MALMNHDNMRKWIMDDDTASNNDPNNRKQSKVEDAKYEGYEEPNDYKLHEALRDGIYYIIADLIKEMQGLYQISGDIVKGEIHNRFLELMKELISHAKYNSSNLDLYIEALSKESFKEDSFFDFFRFLEGEYEKGSGERHPSQDQHPVGSYHFKSHEEKNYKDLLEGAMAADVEKFLLSVYPEFADYISFTFLIVKIQTLKIIGKHYVGDNKNDSDKTTIRIESYLYKLIQHQTHIRQQVDKLFIDTDYTDFHKKEIIIKDFTNISLGMKWRTDSMMMEYGVKNFKTETDDFWKMFRRKYGGGLRLKLNIKPVVTNSVVYELFKIFPRGTKTKAKLYLFVNVKDYLIFSNGRDADKNMVKKK